MGYNHKKKQERIMVRHIVCYKLKDPTPQTLEKTKEVFLSMKGRVPEISDISVGIDELHSERSYDMVLDVTFPSFEAMQSYQQNEYHVSVVKKHVHAVKSASVSVDYEF